MHPVEYVGALFLVRRFCTVFFAGGVVIAAEKPFDLGFPLVALSV